MSPPIKTPLLPKQEPSSEKHGSTSGVVFNVSTSIIGAGIMSMPAAFKVLGVIPALLIITIIGWLSTISVGFLMKSTLAGEATTYAGVMKESFGKTGSVAVQVATMVATFGCMVIFSIIIGDVLSGNDNGGSVHLGVLQEWLGSHWWNTRIFALLFIYAFVLLPLVLCRRVERLAFSSAISFLLAVLFVVISSVLAITALMKGQTKNPRLFPDLTNEGSFWNLFTASPVIVTAFTFHFNVHPIGFELKDPLHVIPATKISVILCAAIYFATGLFGYLLFGDATMSDILVNFDQSSGSSIGSLFNDIVRLSYALHLMLVFPLMNFSLRANLDELMFPTMKLSLAKDTKRFIGLTLALLICCFLSAIAVPDIWYFFQFLGSTTTVSIAFIFPAAIVLRNVHGVSTSREKIVAAIMLVLAVATSIIAISTNLYSLTAN
ncbi:Transmembrane amino acid transporter family protein [Raphanus sativus]|uniref:Amino acid transporter AVT6C n=1 Tax=Raphanus sativus TaxID=3726 RepID=A0A6J0LLW7_RAPSA|nr:amino acid transporter AVT6C [Raphanus sativus]KAJ4895975.1 Transmembrane amino acid transporter family protein [Raphanus sativus]